MKTFLNDDVQRRAMRRLERDVKTIGVLADFPGLENVTAIAGFSDQLLQFGAACFGQGELEGIEAMSTRRPRARAKSLPS